MKIRFKRDVLVDVVKSRLDEVWDVNFRKWQELTVETVKPSGRSVTLTTSDGDTLLNVPEDAYEKIA
jgi:hypothetical protein